MDYYRILEVDKEASPEVIKKAYRALSLKYHPDKLASGSPDAEKMPLINEAYGVLSDPDLRGRYDHSRVNIDVWLSDGLLGLARNWLAGVGSR